MRRLRDCGSTLVILKDLVWLLPFRGYGFVVVEYLTPCFGFVADDIEVIHGV